MKQKEKDDKESQKQQEKDDKKSVLQHIELEKRKKVFQSSCNPCLIIRNEKYKRYENITFLCVFLK